MPPPYNKQILKTFHISNLASNVHVRFLPIKAPFFTEGELLTDEGNPIWTKAYDEYSKIPSDILRFRFNTRTTTKNVSRAVLRNRIKRRYTDAFATVLRNNGFYTNGRKMTGLKNGTALQVGLVGTLEVSIFASAGLTLPWKTLLADTQKIFNVVVAKQDERARPVKVQSVRAQTDKAQFLWKKLRVPAAPVQGRTGQRKEAVQ
jgi:hypothetical protein